MDYEGDTATDALEKVLSALLYVPIIGNTGTGLMTPREAAEAIVNALRGHGFVVVDAEEYAAHALSAP